MDRGLTPTLEKLASEGAPGVLNSAFPYLAPVAWSTTTDSEKYIICTDERDKLLNFVETRRRL